MTGNTVIDALLHVSGRITQTGNQDLQRISGRRSVLVTAHRRESWGEPMAQTARAIARLARNSLISRSCFPRISIRLCATSCFPRFRA